VSDSWRERPEAGSPLALRITIWFALRFGRSALTVILYFTACYFLMVRSAERRASRDFLERAGCGPVSVLDVFRHFRIFARVTADRVFFLADRAGNIPVKVDGREIIDRYVQKGTGCVFLGSHLGSFEATRMVSTHHSGVRVRVVLDRNASAEFIQRMEALNHGFADSVIDAGQPAAVIGLTIAESIAAGDSVGVLADRFRPGDRTVSVDFMGQPAKFPAGPLMMAAAIGVPVVLVFGLYRNGGYEVYCEEFFDTFRLPRANREAALREGVQRYADRLAFYARKAPYNWFNFYDFWASGRE
jgi:predicted LPLAT superfamily acyltransferase